MLYASSARQTEESRYAEEEAAVIESSASDLLDALLRELNCREIYYKEPPSASEKLR